MWALINTSDNSITEIIRFPKTIVTSDNITHPRSIFTKWSWSELNAINIYTVEATTGMKDEKFYYNSQPEYKFDATNKKITSTVTTSEKALDDSEAKNVEDGSNILDEKGNKTYNYGLKTQAKNQATTTANGYLKRFDWLIARNVTASTAIPDAVKTYMAAIRTDHKDICDAIDAASDMAAFQLLFADTYNYDSDGEITSVKEVARVNRWTDSYDVEQYAR